MLKRDERAEPIEEQIQTIEGGSEPVEARVAKILDALHDGALRYKSEVAIYPIMDTLQLLIQKPSVFAVINGKDFSLIFSTCRDPEYRESFETTVKRVIDRSPRGHLPEEYTFVLPGLRDDGPNYFLFATQFTSDLTFPSLEAEDADTLRRLIKALGTNERTLSSHITRAARARGKKLAEQSKTDPLTAPAPDRSDYECNDDLRLPQQSQDNYADWMRNIVSKGLSEVAASPILKQKGKPWLNLYCSIRRAIPGKRHQNFPYTVQYVLTRQQKDAIGNHFKPEVAAYFEYPLGKECRSISDSVFFSGVNEFIYAAPESEDSPGPTWRDRKDALDRKRDDAELKILGMQAANAGGKIRFIVPIHVGGVVWATLFTSQVSDWTNNYRFYRVLLTQTAERLRVAAKSEYRDRLRKIFASEMEEFKQDEKGETIDDTFTRINGQWRKLTTYFPYNGIEAKPNIGERKFVTLDTFRNPHPCFKQSLAGFDLFDDEDLKGLADDLNPIFERTLIFVEQRRLALRTAAAAIMGRNMSHNLGSHVLARYSAGIRKDGTQASDGQFDRRSEFLTYLQRRMDFLAEVSTSDQPFWSETLWLKEQLGRLNYEAQKKHLGGNGPILLSYITGKDAVAASVEWGLPPDQPTPSEPGTVGEADPLIACPGGEVGIHALYIILENIIRNSARHAPAELRGPVSIHVNVKDEGYKEFLTVDIIDPRSDVNAARHGDLLLHEHINTNLDARILKSDNTPDPRNWGIREMQICAHYLRGLPFSELGRKRLERSPTIQQHESEHDPRGVQEDTLPVLKAYAHPLPDGRECLKYTIYLQRAKLMAAVVDAGDQREESVWKAYDRASLRRNGIRLVELPNGHGVEWESIAREIGGYGFLLVEDGISLSKQGTPDRVPLPMRVLDGWLAENIKKRIELALKSDNLVWMEPLHEEAAKYYRDRRGYPWKLKPIWGVAICRKYLQPHASVPREPAQLNGGLIAVQASHDDKEHIWPLPSKLGEDWYPRLQTTGQHGQGRENEFIAAAWIDHATNEDFRPRGARLHHAKDDRAPNRSELRPETVWITAEGAYSDRLHHAFLSECAGTGWELLAAAMPRVAVLDERVQSEFDKSGPRQLPFDLLWPAMGVWVPRKKNPDGSVYCDLDVPNFAQCKMFLKKPAEKAEQYPIDILVVHLTVLEGLKERHKLTSQVDKSLNDILADLIADTEAEKADVVLVTGRGVPEIKMNNVRYLPISALLESLLMRPSKLGLMRILWSASRPRNQ